MYGKYLRVAQSGFASQQRFLPMLCPHRSIVTSFDPSMGDLMELSNNAVVVVKFTAKWCGPCQTIAPQFSALSDQYPKISFYHVDVDENSSVGQNFSVRTLPSFLVLNKGKIEARTEGSAIAPLKDAIEKTIGPAESAAREEAGKGRPEAA
ncbi:thioredoxin-like protein [Perkinsela sp. CCAP 1560/4]|nr:thioredoxin-like protein [Perkinsela sp. CCAP 1560/4]|eukprot:KNH08331.1 thioredoxin-like protein [Perkinsela sp. CCAP 1560/4]